MPGHFQGGPNNPGVPGRLPFFNDAFFRPPYHFGMLGSHKNGDLGPRQAVNGFPFPPGNGAHFGPQHRPPFFPRITDDFALRQSNQPCFNQVIFSQHNHANVTNELHLTNKTVSAILTII